MKMNLTECLQKQKTLDERIMALHGQVRESTRLKRILALIVEIAELANETRAFKYWSLKGPSDRDTLLEEFSDTVHFILSLGIDLGHDELTFDHEPSPLNLSELFIEWTKEAVLLNEHFNEIQYQKVLTRMGQVADACGFSEEDILYSYHAKNDTNHKRQDQSY